jgi:hypothetical protein
MIKTLSIIQCSSSKCRRFLSFNVHDINTSHTGGRCLVRCICGQDTRINQAVVEDIRAGAKLPPLKEEADAPAERKEPEGGEPEHPAPQEEGPKPEAGGGDLPQEGGEEQEPSIPSDEAWAKAVEAQQALNSHGSIAAAARALRVVPPTIKNRVSILSESDKDIIAGGAVPPKHAVESSDA